MEWKGSVLEQTGKAVVTVNREIRPCGNVKYANMAFLTKCAGLLYGSPALCPVGDVFKTRHADRL
jgi:hypothetical protein